jgi:hypothetical protein
MCEEGYHRYGRHTASEDEMGKREHRAYAGVEVALLSRHLRESPWRH